MSHSNSSSLRCQQQEEPPCPDLQFQFGQFLTISALEWRDLFHESPSSSSFRAQQKETGDEEEEEDDDDDDDVGDSEEMSPANSSKRKPHLLGGLSAVDDNDNNEEDGFRTPTGPEHRISEPRDCPSPPPPPRKRRHVPIKTTSVMSKARRRIQLDLCKELNDFPSLASSSSSSSSSFRCTGVYGDDITGDNHRNKRARTDCSSSN